MMHLKNISVGQPKTREQYILAKQHKVILLFSEEGKDWYAEQKKFSADTLKIAYNRDNVIVSVNTDVSAINPNGLSVVEVANTTANRRADISGNWLYKDGAVVRREPTPDELTAQAEEQKRQRLAAASAAIAPLQDAVDLGIATERETAQLLAWKQYRVRLNRTVLTTAPAVSWPDAPQV